MKDVAAGVEVKTLEVPGARLHYEVRGRGPVLLMIPGGPADAGAFSTIGEELASHYRVVTYDPRGLSHSPLEGPFDDERAVQINADDAHRLISAVTRDKANVFGNSGGAVISLELAARHPEQIATLVAHETPCAAVLPDPARARTEMIEIVESFKTGGLGVAFPKFAAHVGIRGGPPPQQGDPTPEQLEAMAMMQRNMEFWFGHTFRAIGLYEPDVEALKNAPCRILSAVGEESRGELANTGGLGLAKQLGSKAVVFPGAHGGFQSHAVDFAIKLREVLEA